MQAEEDYMKMKGQASCIVKMNVGTKKKFRNELMS